MSDASDQTSRLDGRWPAAILIGAVISAAFVADRLIPNSLLSLPLMAAILVSTLITWWGVPRLRALKMGQVIRTEGPQGHLSKSGTPTMGGLLVVPVGVIIGGLVSSEGRSAQQLLAIALVTLAYMVIGGVDDWSSLTKRTNTGLTPRGKLLLQATAAVLFLGWAGWQGWIAGTVSLPFNLDLPLHWLIWPLALFVFLAESNATNLTDGLDGLASGCGALVFTGLALQLMLRGNAGDPALAGFCMAMAGCWLGFLIHNRNPAKVFMGDTGSLAMGAALSAVALLSDSLWPLLLMGGVFLAESVSVIVQVWVFKATKGADGQGRRVFRMAPLHHHFELGGTPEQVVVPLFWLVTAGLVMLGLGLHPR
ncbi:phospho-N-acetylmuramoyl-pentapeptide-transferase [Synechococcus sp. CS-197]|uniref:Phospho-N-acetylmuramoyl-pentapeptide-transferase n=1 Tax=Synechococcus sp. (strain WH7803) TaxID=32051 RepID=MRAY_SYNPW|nr:MULTISPECIES: phospho-N-acetylmuramoyl-pentapeptide-transferase [unclassified Synechococcus]A5GPT3.1 RecName: Full=Phospho-N-acetylmuramoyl-pentapeptide-transferase; AltName: Full=UDP-MurNAc-pentapeptide phosphotransferase [Synechococcus sp. WH 7803]PTU04246.1 phospho-N-acetylmuramoyl-pentapeptide-transferase [Pseudomonas sp. HMWF031]MCT0251106.1 phospho-N-acetylmuramoyl-pentapeptide-transferase [Synechococcus sp. CS-197]QNI69151.1 phospho-N-acetylmuramoyl-pentapeptide-transferase [Synechoco